MLLDKYDSYKPSGIEWLGDIPKGWGVNRVKWISQIENSGIWGKDEEFTHSISVPIPTTAQLSIDGKWDYKKMSLRNITVEEWEKYKCIKGDTVVVKSSGSSSSIITGKCGYISQEDSEKFGFGNFLLRVRPIKIESKLIYYFLSSNLTKQRIERMVSSTTYPNLKIEEYSKAKLPIPPLAEQKAIVSFLDKKTGAIDKLVDSLKLKVDSLKEYRTALINEVVTGKKVVTKDKNGNFQLYTLNSQLKKSSGIEWIGNIPKHWEIVRLNNLGKFKKGKGITKDKILKEGYSCIRYGEIYTSYNLRFEKIISFIGKSTIKESVVVKKGTLLFVGDGETLEEIGKCVCYEGKKDLYVGGGIHIFNPNLNKTIPIYLSYAMGSNSAIFQKSRQAKGEIVVHIYAKQLKEIKLGLPPIAEQKAIVEYLDEQTAKIDKTILNEQKRITLLQEYKQALISETVTGKFRVES